MPGFNNLLLLAMHLNTPNLGGQAAGIGVGSSVDLWVTSDDGAGARSRLVQTDLVVIEVADADRSLAGTRGPTVYVAVPAEDVGAVLDSVASGGEIALVGTAA